MWRSTAATVPPPDLPLGGVQSTSSRPADPVGRVRLRRVQRVTPITAEQAAFGMNTLVLHGFIFQTVFVRVAVVYMRVFSSSVRRLFESLALSAALLMLFTMLYTQYALEAVSEQCLHELGRDLPVHGVLRLEVVRGAPANYTLNMSYAKEEAAWNRYRDDSLLRLIDNFLESANRPQRAVDSGVSDALSSTSHCIKPVNIFQQYLNGELSGKLMCSVDSNGDEAGTRRGGDSGRILTDLEQGISWFSWSDFVDTPWSLFDDYIVEFGLDSGLLRLSRQLRERLSVPVRLLVLDPDRHACFGDRLTRLVLSNVVGYDDIMLASLKQLSERRLNSVGFLRNVITGDHYRFVSNWGVSTSLVSAAVMMFVFTLTVTMLLRYCHQQIYTFLLSVLRVGGDGMTPATASAAARLLAVPTASLMTIVLALVGLVTWMTEFFNYSTISFHVIFIVWLVDQFDTFCCHSQMTRKHFLRFFYLYHFCFYVHQYCYSGQFGGMALATSWLFTQHAMLYFLHHYELPMIDRNMGLRRLVHDAIHQENQRMSGTSTDQQESQRMSGPSTDHQENQRMSETSTDHQESQRMSGPSSEQQENQPMSESSVNQQENQLMSGLSADNLESQRMSGLSAEHQESQPMSGSSAEQQEYQLMSGSPVGHQENQEVSESLTDHHASSNSAKSTPAHSVMTGSVPIESNTYNTPLVSSDSPSESSSSVHSLPPSAKALTEVVVSTDSVTECSNVNSSETRVDDDSAVVGSPEIIGINDPTVLKSSETREMNDHLVSELAATREFNGSSALESSEAAVRISAERGSGDCGLVVDLDGNGNN